MQKITILEIEPKGSWEGQYGKMYESWVKFSNGREGLVNSKSETTWSVGDAVEIKESTPGKYGTKFKISKFQEPETRGFESRSSSPEIQLRIDASWAIGQAIAMGIKGNQIGAHALWLIEMRDAVIKRIQGGENTPETAPEQTPPAPTKQATTKQTTLTPTTNENEDVPF